MNKNAGMPPRRVLLIVSEIFANGGIQRFNRTFLDALGKLHVDGDVLSLADTPESMQRWHRPGRMRVCTFGRNKVAFAAAVVRAILFGGYDEVVIGHIHFLALAAGARVLRRRPRLLLVAHGVEVWKRVSGVKRRALSAADRILCVSEYTATSIREQAPEIPANRFTIFPNALADFWVETMGGLALDAPRVAAPYLLAVARLTHHDRTKGIVHALEAFARLARPGLEFVVAGHGDDVPYLRELVRQLGIQERVRFPGAVSDAELVALYRGCEAFVLPSSQEGFGIVFLEAMFFGVPVIGAREKGAVDVIRDGETGLLVPYADIDAIQHAIARVLDDRALRASLIAAALDNVTRDGRFTAAAFVRRLDRLLGDPPPQRRVVFVNRYFHPDESATSRMVSDLARRLARAGVRVDVVTSRGLYHDPAAALPSEEWFEGIAIHRVAGERFGRAGLAGRALDHVAFHLAAGARLRRLLQADDVVVAKTDPPLLSVTVARAARVRGALLVNWLQDVFPEVASELGVAVRPRWLLRLLLELRNRTLRCAACNVAIGTRMAERIAAQGIERARVRVIPNWADLTEISPRARHGNPVRAELGLDDSHFIVGYSGNLGRAHEYGTLLDAAGRLRDRPEFVFVITGGGAKVEALRRDVETLGLANFRFRPFQASEGLADSMGAADVHLVSLLPALEGLIVPSKFYGILAAGRAAVFVGDPDGELAREIRALDCGFSVAVNDGAGLAAGIERLYADPERLAVLGANARRAAEQRFSSEGAVAAWLALLGTLGAPAPAPHAAATLDVQSGT